jgi:hypothetical protein
MLLLLVIQLIGDFNGSGTYAYWCFTARESFDKI